MIDFDEKTHFSSDSDLTFPSILTVIPRFEDPQNRRYFGKEADFYFFILNPNNTDHRL